MTSFSAGGPAAGNSLLAEFMTLRHGPPLSSSVFPTLGAKIIKAAGLDSDTSVSPHDRLRSALEAMSDHLAGRALSSALGVGSQGPNSELDHRRREFVASEDNISSDVCAELEERAIYELTLRLLGRHYPLAPGGEVPPITGNFLVKSLRTTAIYRNGRLIGRRQKVDILAVSVNGLLHYTAPVGARLGGLTNVEVESSENLDDHVLFKLRPLKQIDRGESYPIGFAEILPLPDRRPRIPRHEHYEDLLPHAMVYRILRVEFMDEAPRTVTLQGGGNRLRLSVAAKQIPTQAKTRVDWQETEDARTSEVTSGTKLRLEWKWNTPSPLRIVLAISFLLLAAVDLSAITGYETELARNIFVIARVLFASLALREIYRYFWLRNRMEFRASHDYSVLQQVPLSAIAPLQEQALDTKACSRAQAAIFALGVTQSRMLRQRVAETYNLNQRTVSQGVSIEVQVSKTLLLQTKEFQPSQSSSDDENDHPLNLIYFPVLLPLKSKFQDSFRVVGPDGAGLHILPYREYLKLAAVVLRTLLVQALRGGTSHSIAPAAIEAEREALALLTSRREADGDAPDIPENFDWHKKIELPIDASPAEAKALQWAKDFVEMLTYHYAIVVPLAVDDYGRAFVRYEQTLTPDLSLDARKRLALLLGARPIDLSFGIRLASTCQSYHLEVNGPDGLYLGDQRLVDSSATLARRAQNEDVPPHYRFRRRLGQPHAHMYARFFPEPAPVPPRKQREQEHPSVRLKFFETPPGSLLRAVVSAQASFALVWMVGIVNSSVPNTETDAPAFLLAFPAVVSAWLGFESAGRRLLEGTLAFRLSLACTVFVSIVSSGLFISHRSLHTTHNWYQLPDGWAIFWINDWSWLAMLTIAMVNAYIVTLLYIKRTAYYSYLASRNQGEDVKSYG